MLKPNFDEDVMSKILSGLFKKRPVFLSEKDFQNHLIDELKTFNTDGYVISEYAVSDTSSGQRCDIFVSGNKRIGIELKYKTCEDEYEIGTEKILLKEHGARDQAQYDFIKDIIRLETWCDEG